MSKSKYPSIINEQKITGIVDSHCHYDDASFLEEQDTLIPAIHQNGVETFINIGCDMESCKTGIELTQRFPYFYCTVGVHPETSAKTLEKYPDYLKTLEAYTQTPKVVGIGEIGLDYYYDDGAPRDIQKRVFEEQLALAVKLDMPVSIHSRDASADTLALLKQYRPKGVVHCFSGSPETASEILKLGMYIGFTGVLTFSNAKKAAAVAQMVPLDRFLLETDCPYMAPVPFRGKRCQSDMIAYTAQKMADIKQLPVEQILALAKENTLRLFQIQR